jgi:hypothetical protein
LAEITPRKLIMLKKLFLTSLIILVSGLAIAQEDSTYKEKFLKTSLKSYEIPKKSALGIKFGYFMSLGVSYQYFITNNSAIDMSLGFRPTGGFVRWAENLTRVGGQATYQRMYPLDVRQDGTIHFFWALGWHAGSVEWKDLENERVFQTGPLAGVGFDFRMEKYSINLSVLPGFDLASKDLDKSSFFINKASGIAVRFLF